VSRSRTAGVVMATGGAAVLAQVVFPGVASAAVTGTTKFCTGANGGGTCISINVAAQGDGDIHNFGASDIAKYHSFQLGHSPDDITYWPGSGGTGTPNAHVLTGSGWSPFDPNNGKSYEFNSI
jgi:hypothetical protein